MPAATKLVDIPRTGQRYYTEFNITLRNNEIYKLPVVSLDFSKDITASTGDGTVTIPNVYDLYEKLYYGEEFIIKGGWDVASKQGKELFKGTIEEIKRNSLNLEITFKDKGKLLEAQSSVSFTQQKRSHIIKQIIEMAGLEPYIDFGDQPDDIIDYSTASSSTGGSGANEWQTRNDYNKSPKKGNPPAGAGVISGEGWYPVNQCAGPIPWKSFPFSWVNYCPACGRAGTLKLEGKPTLGGIYCTSCDVDYDPVGGFGTSVMVGGREVGNAPTGTGTASCKLRLTPAGNTSNSTSNSSTVPASTEMSDTTEGDMPTDATETGQSNKSYWDMLTELCDPLKIDLQFFVWIDTCFVTAVPPDTSAVLVIDDRENVIKDNSSINSATIKDEDTGLGDGSTDTAAVPGGVPNVVIVNYGAKALPQSVTVRHEDSIQMFGEIKQQYNRYDLNADQAETFANKMLNKLNRENGFNIDVTVVGHPEFFVGRWAKVNLTRYNFEDTLYIKVAKIKLSATESVKYDLNLVNYYPLIEAAGGKEGGADTGTLDEIGRREAKFGSVQGVCSHSDCYERLGRGDCWADSEWLYNKLNAAGISARIMGNRGGSYPRHTWVEINTGSGWTTYPYSKYGSKHTGIPSGVGKVFVLIPEGKQPARISGI